MAHEILNSMAERRRKLPIGDASRYRNLRLVVTRDGPDTACVSLLVVNAKNETLSDTRIFVARISIRDENGLLVSDAVALQRAIERL